MTLASAGRRDNDHRIYSLWIVTTILLSPIAWHHYLVLLVLPFVQMAIAVLNDRARPRELWMATASYLLACVSVPITFQLLAHPTAFQRAFPSLSVPLLETGFSRFFGHYRRAQVIVHGAGGVLLQHLKEHQLHTDMRHGDRIFCFTTCGWMMWNWLVSGLASGATLLLYDGSPFHPHPEILFATTRKASG